ncbi:MAG TPA: PP2C family protein-serine/threonine phosphatase [Streptomyces sp.]|nr:PP2C family protein-serine/threonine phosphatase [Streptomyces sp.]
MDGVYETLRGLLLAAESAAPGSSVDTAVARLADQVGARQAGFWVVDLTGRAVLRLTTAGTEDRLDKPASVPLEGSDYQAALTGLRPRLIEDAERGGFRMIAPVTHRGDAIGLLELGWAGPPSAGVMGQVAAAAHMLAYLLIADQRFTDRYTWGKPIRPRSLAAEIQRNLLPPSLSCQATQFSLCGHVEPSGGASGDTFDYALDSEALFLSVTDPMGHDMAAAVAASVLTGAVRQARGSGADLLTQAARIDEALLHHDEGHATGQLLRINLTDGATQFVNAGHPWPFRLRDGHPQEIPCHIDQPFGLPFPHTYRLQHLDLRPGDRLVFFTDGMLERGSTSLNLPSLLTATHRLRPREAALALTAAAVEANAGVLEDDATAVCLDWHGTPPH